MPKGWGFLRRIGDINLMLSLSSSYVLTDFPIGNTVNTYPEGAHVSTGTLDDGTRRLLGRATCTNHNFSFPAPSSILPNKV